MIDLSCGENADMKVALPMTAKVIPNVCDAGKQKTVTSTIWQTDVDVWHARSSALRRQIYCS